MTRWSPQLYRKQGLDAGEDQAVMAAAIAVAEETAAVNPDLPPVFTLKHIAHQTGTDYGFLRAIVSRANEEPYRIFRIRKRPASNGEKRFRVIAVPSPGLLKVQRWITQAILSRAKPHPASVAFSKGDTLVAAVEPHCGCRWLIKLDVRNFFESINEIAVYRVFRSLGYQRLVAFEMARLCTRLGGRSLLRMNDRWSVRSWRWSVIKAYYVWRPSGGPLMGHLPQGAPTSPMLANLAVRKFDELVAKIADRHGLTYTRYADDLTLSSRDGEFSRRLCGQIIREVYAAMGQVGLSPNATKTRVIPPGSRKIVLGLLADGKKPRLPRDFRANMRRHIHFLTRSDVGPIAHIKARGFTSVVGFKHHIYGLVSFARQIEPEYADQCTAALKSVDWPI